MMTPFKFLATQGWDLGTFLQNADTTVNLWAVTIIGILGTVLLLFSIVKLVKGFTGNQGQPEWGKIIVMFIISGILLAGGWSFLKTMAGDQKKTIEDLGNTILPYYFEQFKFTWFLK